MLSFTLRYYSADIQIQTNFLFYCTANHAIADSSMKTLTSTPHVNTQKCLLFPLDFTPRDDFDIRLRKPSSSSMYFPKPPIFLLLQDSNNIMF